jgi:hypothetical protein
LISDGVDASGAFISPIEVVREIINHLRLIIDHVWLLSRISNGSEETLKLCEGLVSQRVALNIVGDPSVGALSDGLNDL